MYFSRIRINMATVTQRDRIQIFHGDSYYSHKLMWKLFPDEHNSDRFFVYRQEFEQEQIPFEGQRSGMPLFYMVSKHPPVESTGYLEVDTKVYSPQIDVGMRLEFNIRVNPTVTKTDPVTNKTKKHDVLMDAKTTVFKQETVNSNELQNAMNASVIEWISRKGLNNGFSLPKMDILEISGYRQHALHRRGGKHIKFSSVDIKGSLVVDHCEQFLHALYHGIGRSKSFGCGMMLVRRI